jgi:hypothetical protein
MYERASLDDMRALRSDSVDVFARARDYADQVIGPDRAPAAGGRDAIRARSSTRNWSRSLIAWGIAEDQLAEAEPLRDRACPIDLGIRVAARVVDGLDVYAGHLHHAASS